ncbi:alpha-keto acid decarboxylase family protein [Macrococcus hajekii]|uniref:Alpha-keto-acid decarboxylase n=1 Tax=Macrococcus hajekii TaxID=198482 RepID=A0A4R6BJ42_9STAP|nr:alpha-keto acid decarboxylase family protein [Macrococcus hajekii]TDM01709.1 alpha-keto acid decarboxylase family protein [Macrococcus hajekii]GGB06747.1 pyruvate decarboxylase [Macrococcus hajekii]
MKRRVGQYLIDQISVYGVDQIFGVPGDFNLAFLDDIVSHEQVEWIGNTNELNASYAADGYARIKGLGALVTTFGVGELSAVNGIAGSYAERVPVVAITGAPTTVVEQAKRYVHHSLGEGVFDDYQRMFEPITCGQIYLTADNAAIEIPRIIAKAIRFQRPVHIHLPIDVAMTEIEVKEATVQPMLSQDVSVFTDLIQERLKEAQQPVLIAGHEINSFKLHEELEQFVNQTHIPVAQLSLGKGAFNEENPHYIGIFDGKIAHKDVRDYVNSSDCIINLGAKLTDSATAGFSYEFKTEDVIFINDEDFRVDSTYHTDVSLRDMMRSLLTLNYENTANFTPFNREHMTDFILNDEALTQENYFKMINHFLQQDDVLLAEQGTSFFGAYDLVLYAGNQFIGQPLWGSIGYTLPALLGTQMADKKRRNVLLIGDGSFQLTAQELSTMIRHQLKPIIFLINNDGYTVERLIHGEKEIYNDIQMWDYTALPAVFGGKDHVQTHKASTSNELKTVMDTVDQQPDKMHFIEVTMGMLDAPEKLVNISKAFAAQNK